jgi:surface protein
MRRSVHRLKQSRARSGFSMLEAVVVVGVLLALAVGGFLAYGQITTNAKIAKVKSAASEIYTAALVNQIDGDPRTKAEDVIETYNNSNEKIKAEIRPWEPGELLAAMPTTVKAPIVGEEFCVTATMIEEPDIFAENGFCSPESDEDNQPGDGSDPDDETGGGSSNPDNKPVALPAPKPVIDPDAVMITTWNTDLADNCSRITLPITGASPGTITWGENGTPVSLSYNKLSPIFPKGTGEVKVNIHSTFGGWGEYNWNDSNCLVSVDRWGETGTTNLQYAFINADNLQHVERIPSTTTSLYNAFKNIDSNFTLGGFDTSKVTTLSEVFSGTSNFNQNLNNWDVSSVINMYKAFQGASSFNQPLNNWNVTKVTEMRWAFENADNFNKLNQDLSSWDTSNVRSMAYMFGDALSMKHGLKYNTFEKTTALTYKCDVGVSGDSPTNGYPLTYAWNDGNTSQTRYLEPNREYKLIVEGEYSGFRSGATWAPCLRSVDHWGSNTGVVDALNAFKGAVNLVNVPSRIPNTITDMRSMFEGATEFNDPDVSNWDTSSTLYMSKMFYGASKFNQNINSWDTSKVILMQRVFQNAVSFNQPLNNWDVGVAYEMRWMFDGADAFNQDLSSWDTSSARSMAFMFGDAFAMKHGVKHNTLEKTTILTYKCDVNSSDESPTNGNPLTYSWNDGVELSKRSLVAGKEYNLVVEGPFSSLTNGRQWTSCLRSVDHWGVETGTKTATGAFKGAVNLVNVPSRIPNTIYDMQSMFEGATELNDSDISNWDVSSATSMNKMFLGATSFNQPLNNWNTSKVINMKSAFQNAAAFNQPLNNWNVGSVYEMRWMFDGADSFNHDLSAWDTSRVRTMAFMFGDAFAMKHGVTHNTFGKTTTLTYKCDVRTPGYVPIGAPSTDVTWSDGEELRNKTLAAEVEYTVVIEGTYSRIGDYTQLASCLRSVDHWGSNTGVTSSMNAFKGAINLTNVPASMPNTLTDIRSMFEGATELNDSDIIQLNTSNVVYASKAFYDASNFNQNLSNWNVNKVSPNFKADFSTGSALTPENLPKFK